MKKTNKTNKAILLFLIILFTATPFINKGMVSAIFVTPPTCDEGDGCMPNCSGAPDPDCVSGCADMPGSAGLIPCGKRVNDPDTSWNECSECNLCFMILMGRTIIEFFIKLTAVAAIMAIIIGGFFYVFSVGSVEIISKAKLAIKYSIFGFIIVFVSWAITDSALIILGYMDPMENDDWYNVTCDLGTFTPCVPSLTCADYPGQCGSMLSNGCVSVLNCSNNCGVQLCCKGICQDPVCSNNGECDDGDICTVDTCGNPNTCDAACVNTPIPGCCDTDGVCDGICPSNCTPADDPDCAVGGCCGDNTCDAGEDCFNCADCYCTGIQVCCSGSCQDPQCTAANQTIYCDDGDVCTKNICSIPGVCTGICSNPPVDCSGIVEDTCCPPGCDATNDIDCGAGVCVTDGFCDDICPDNCTLADDPDCGVNGCCGDNTCDAGEDCNSCADDCGTCPVVPCSTDPGCHDSLDNAYEVAGICEDTKKCYKCNATFTWDTVSGTCEYTGLPVAFDWSHEEIPSALPLGTDNWMSPVRMQRCGSCWSYSATGAVEGKYNIEQNNPALDIDLSEGYLVSTCCNAGSCNGGWPDWAMGCIRSAGVPDDACFPQSGNNDSCNLRCADWSTRLWKIGSCVDKNNPSRDEMKSLIINYGPLSGYVRIAESDCGYVDGIYRCGSSSCNHAIVIVGYDDAGEYWVVRNSWGSSYNGNGYYKVGYGECGIESWGGVHYPVGVVGP